MPLPAALWRIGLAMGIPKDSPDVSAVRDAAANTRDLILDVYFKEFRSILCKDIQRKYFGKAWNLADDEMAHEFLSITKGCIIPDAVNTVVKCILDENEKGHIKT